MKDTLANFWKWDNAIPEPILKVMDSESQSLTRDVGKTEGAMGAAARKSDIAMVGPQHWFCGILLNYAIQANLQANWKRDLSFPECLQFSDYGVGQYYDWHTDATILTAEPINRKLSVICLLTDPSEFDGGALEFEHTDLTVDLKRGSVIVFPSMLRHRVTPVTRGLRTTLVSWILGPTVW